MSADISADGAERAPAPRAGVGVRLLRNIDPSCKFSFLFLFLFLALIDPIPALE
jgi:hypothetical protein